MGRDLECIVEIAADEVGFGERLKASGELRAGDVRQPGRQQAPLERLRSAVALFVEPHVLQRGSGTHGEIAGERQLFFGVAPSRTNRSERHPAEDPAP